MGERTTAGNRNFIFSWDRAGGGDGTFRQKYQNPQNINKKQLKTTTGRASSVLVVPTAEVLTGREVTDK